LVVGALVAAGGVVLVLPAGASQVAAAPATGSSAGQGTWVTLLTGDRVLVSATGSARPTVDIGRRGAPVSYAIYQRRGDWYVVPGDAAPGLAANRLDDQLFNVSSLVRQGYDDAHRDTLPVLVSYAKSTTAAKVVAAATGTRAGRRLEDRRLVALDADRSHPERFWSTLTAPKPSMKAALPAAGVEKVWLNARVQVSLDQSTTQIGAPVAWQAGYRGAGVRIAVLDTGIKADHPDFANRIAEARDFTDVGSANDDNGHGTHVASIAAGSGAASGGTYKGVAPEATLLVGKVLNSGGYGYSDDILAGMEWAAGTAHADVVNMSLGGGPTDGTDPLSQAVNDLSARYGTLFVIAAGNSFDEGTVSAPSVADAALSVASVGRTDVRSVFSSQGPRAIDAAVKPELAAPGENIAAARAPGTVVGDLHPVDDHYTRLSGTSMATPHVAGAAAILAQEHPDWSGAQLKATLVTTAADVHGTVNGVGTGRLDVARATTQTVTASVGTLATFLAWPHTGDNATKTMKVTYHNAGTSPATLQLGLSLAKGDGTAAPAGLSTLDNNVVSVPPGGDTPVTVTIAAQAGHDGLYQGVLAATADGVSLRTAIAVTQEDERYSLTVTTLDRDGATPDGSDMDNAYTYAIGIDNGEVYRLFGDGTGRLPAGRYALHSVIMTSRPFLMPSMTALADPELNLRADTSITMDARTAKEATLSVDKPAGRAVERTLMLNTWIAPAGRSWGTGIYSDTRYAPLYLGSVSGARSDTFTYLEYDHLEEPLAEVFLKNPDLELPLQFANTPNPQGRWRLTAVYGGNGSPEQLAGKDLSGKLVVLELSTPDDETALSQRIAAIAHAGAAMVALAATTGEYGGSLDGSALPLPTLRLPGHGELSPQIVKLFEAARIGTVKVDVTARANSGSTHDLYAVAQGSLPANVARTVHTNELAAVTQRYYGNGSYYIGNRQVTSVTTPADAHRSLVGGSNQAVQGPLERTEYFTPGTWQLGLFDRADGYLTAAPVTLKASPKYQMNWLAPVFGPAMSGLRSGFYDGLGQPWVSQQDTTLDVVVPIRGDGAGHTPLNQWGTGYTELFRDNASIGRVEAPGAGRFDLPAAKGTYRLVTEANRTDTELSTKVTCDWTVKLGDGQAPPLLTVGFQPYLDLTGTAKPGHAINVPVTVTRQGGAVGPAIASLTVDVSYDDGATWTAGRMTRVGDKWTLALDRTTAGYASLRAHAADTAGNTITQTIIRALRIG
jgi:subtilisin family serine protease